MNLFNHAKYPFENCDPQLNSYHQEFKKNGVLVLKDFVAPEILEKVIQEARDLAKQAYFNKVEGNCYLSDIDPKFPKDHPESMTDFTSLGAVAYDQFSKESLVKAIYKDEKFRTWVAKIIGITKLYEYECPLGALNVSVMLEGDYLRWHFDQSDFVVGIHLQDPSQGGAFEYVRNIRSKTEPNYDGVKNVLLGKSKDVVTLHSPPGCLILFEGRYTIHRVSPVKGQVPRLNMLLGFADKPGITSSEYLRKIRYGRVS